MRLTIRVLYSSLAKYSKRLKDASNEWYKTAETKLKLRTLDDWYKVRKAQLERLGITSSVLSPYDGSLYKAMKNIYPHHEWIEWKFASTSPSLWEDTRKHREYFDWLAKQLNLRYIDDWYQLTANDLKRNYGSALLRHYYNDSVSAAVMATYPDVSWKPWLFANSRKEWWSDVKNHRIYLDWLAPQLGIKEPSDWYKCSVEQFLEAGGHEATIVLRMNGNTLIQMLHTAYPDVKWLPWLFKQQILPKGFWDSKQTRKEFFDWAGKELKVNTYFDWYSVRREDLERIGGATLIKTKGGLISLLQEVYPEFPWKVWKFKFSSVSGFWEKKENQKAFWEWFAKEMNITTITDWYDITPRKVRWKGGGCLMDLYKDSLKDALSAVYPEHNWSTWQFHQPHEGFWHDIKVQVAAELGIKEFTGWYTVKVRDIRAKGGGALLRRYYGDSLVKALLSLYPNHPWQVWKFEYVYKGFWHETPHLKAFIEWAGEEMGIESLHEWYDVRVEDLIALGGAFPVKLYKGIIPMLCKVYPEYNWDKDYDPLYPKVQVRVTKMLQDILNEIEFAKKDADPQNNSQPTA